ncbi:MAG: hypothetical protein GX091_07560 [Peptococcaceae bacterium]|nr:hypothetical protein [Peptococcaceae bacterium]
MNGSLFATHGGKAIPPRTNPLLSSHNYPRTYTLYPKSYAMPPAVLTPLWTNQNYQASLAGLSLNKPLSYPHVMIARSNVPMPIHPLVYIEPDYSFERRLEIILISILILVSMDLIFLRPCKTKIN